MAAGGNPTRLAIVGHSFVRRLHSDMASGRFPQLKPDFGLSLQCRIRFKGLGGFRVTDNRAFDREFVPSLRSFHPKVVVIQAGGNDVDVVHFSAPAEYEENQLLVSGYLPTLLGNSAGVRFWTHRWIFGSQSPIFVNDGVHLNDFGQLRLYRSIRLAIMTAVPKR